MQEQQQDMNMFVVTGHVSEVTFDPRGWATITLFSNMKAKEGMKQQQLTFTCWGERLGDIQVDDDVIIQGYMKGNEVQKKDGGKFIAESRMISTIKATNTRNTVANNEIGEQQCLDDDMPF